MDGPVARPRHPVEPSRGDLVFAAIAPHGELAIPEACLPEQRGLAPATQQAMVELGARFDAARPAAVIVLTPHNVHVDRHLAVVTAATLEGSLEESATPIHLRVPTDRELALAVVERLRGSGIPAVGVSFGGNVPAEAVMPMDWAVLIPLWFMGGRGTPPVPTVIIAPARDLPPQTHVRAGQAIRSAVRESDRRVALIASCDHGHAHRADGPYGFHPAAAEFDRRVRERVRAGDLAAIAALDPALVADAKADSWWQMLMLHGALGQGWRADLLSYEVPTYFGMLCAAFTRA